MVSRERRTPRRQSTRCGLRTVRSLTGTPRFALLPSTSPTPANNGLVNCRWGDGAARPARGCRAPQGLHERPNIGTPRVGRSSNNTPLYHPCSHRSATVVDSRTLVSSELHVVLLVPARPIGILVHGLPTFPLTTWHHCGLSTIHAGPPYCAARRAFSEYCQPIPAQALTDPARHA